MQRLIPLILFITVLTLSLLTEVANVDIVPGFLLNKRNPFNMYLVKLGWAWTSVPLLLLILLGNNNYSSPPPGYHYFNSLKSQIFRYFCATGWWYVFTQSFLFGHSIFDRIFHHYPWGTCSVSQYTDIHTCRAVGHQWASFDVSGHTFILTHSCCFIWSEIMPRLLSIIGSNSSSAGGRNERGRSRFRSGDVQSNISPLIVIDRLLIAFLLGLSLIWYLMLCVTSLHFHTVAEKFAGSTIALLFHYVTYENVYLRWKLYSPY